jgi:hypothetical protein
MHALPTSEIPKSKVIPVVAIAAATFMRSESSEVDSISSESSNWLPQSLDTSTLYDIVTSTEASFCNADASNVSLDTRDSDSKGTLTSIG